MSHRSATVESGKVTVDLTAICPDGRDLVQLGVLLGWYARNTSGGGVLLTSPVNKAQKISIPAQSNIQGHKVAAWAERLGRYADPLKLAVAEAHRDSMLVEREGGTPAMTSAGGFAYQAFVGADGSIDEQVVYSDPAPEPDPEPARPQVVRERPWLAKGGGVGDRRYASEAVTERAWSDGSVDYLCTHPGCGYTNPIPQKVARHYAQAKDHPPVSGSRRYLHSEPYEVKHRTASQRAARLAAQIAGALEELGKPLCDYADWVEVAAAIAEKIVADRDAMRDVEETERGPLSAEQILERIRVLVDDGQFLTMWEENDSLTTRVTELEVAAAECRQRAEDAENEAATIRGEWDALIFTIQQRPK